MIQKWDYDFKSLSQVIIYLGINGLPSVLLMSGLIWYQTKKMAKARKLAKIPATTKALVRFEAQKQNRVVCVFMVKIQLR